MGFGLSSTLHHQLKWLGEVNNWPRIIQDWLYPPTCLLCGDPGHGGLDLCRACAEALPRIGSACPRCALPLAASVPLLCGACQKRPPAFDAAHALLRYEEPASYLIRALKFGARYPAARLLGTLLAEHLEEQAGERPEAIVPVPLHSSRYLERGFNQSIEIARTISHRLDIPLDLKSCRRIRATQAQARLPARDRRKNLRHAFVAADLSYRHVAILDDVVTTGTTVDEVAKTLRRAGAERVEVWACARAGQREAR